MMRAVGMLVRDVAVGLVSGLVLAGVVLLGALCIPVIGLAIVWVCTVGLDWAAAIF